MTTLTDTGKKPANPTAGTNTITPFCSHLALVEDPTTCCSYPSLGNNCFAVDPPAPVNMEYQEWVCLRAGRRTCPVSQSRAKGAPLPASIQDILLTPACRPGLSHVLRRLLVVSLVLITLLVLVAFSSIPDVLATHLP